MCNKFCFVRLNSTCVRLNSTAYYVSGIYFYNSENKCIKMSAMYAIFKSIKLASVRLNYDNHASTI